MSISPYIIFDGDCEEAVNFYAGVFGVKDFFMTRYKDMPNASEYPITKDNENLVLHASFNVGDSHLMFSDTPNNILYLKGNNISISIQANTPEEAKEYFKGLAKDGNITQNMHKSFFSDLYGVLVDKFGIEWQVSLKKA